MKHQHSVEVAIPESVQLKIDRTRDHLQSNKKAYLCAFGGCVAGALGMRMFSRPAMPPITQVVVVQAATAATTD